VSLPCGSYLGDERAQAFLLMMNLNWRFLLFLLLGVLVCSMIAVNKPDGQELLGLLSGPAIGALIVFGYQRWAKR
jgi:hypothetical protein